MVARFRALAVGSLILATAPSPLQAAQGRAGSIAALVSKACANPDFTGSILAGNSTSRPWYGSCGLADRAAHQPIDRRTRFKLFSVSKSITALTVLKLETESRLHVGAPISDYLPDAPLRWRAVTIEQLLQHTSGLPDLTNELYDQLTAAPQEGWSAAMDGVLARHANDPAPASAPGTEWHYNNFGYEILARVVERVSGLPFPDVVQRDVFRPAGMRSAYFAQRINGREGPADQRLARGYACGGPQAAEAISHSFVQEGAGAVIATPDDLLALTRYLRLGRLIPRARLRQMMTSAFKATGGAPYGEGFLIRSANGTSYLQHSGGNNGYIAEWAWGLDDPAFAIILTNSSCADASGLRANLMTMLLRPSERPLAASSPKASRRR